MTEENTASAETTPTPTETSGTPEAPVEAKPEGAFWSIAEVLADMEANPDTPDEATPPATEAADPAEQEAPPAEAAPEHPSDDLLESERAARDADAAERWRAEAETAKSEYARLQKEHETAAKYAGIVERLRSGESPAKVLAEAGIQWRSVVQAALRDPESQKAHDASTQTQSEIERLREDMSAQTKMLAELQQERARQQDITVAGGLVQKHADRWPTLSSNPRAAEAICAEFYRSGGKESAEAIADRLEKTLTERAEFEEWKKSRSAPPAAPQAPKPPPAAPKPAERPPAAETQTEAPPSTPLEAAGKDEDDFAYLTRILGRTPKEREFLYYVTRGVVPSS
jgi:hypothetical protein